MASWALEVWNYVEFKSLSPSQKRGLTQRCPKEIEPHSFLSWSQSQLQFHFLELYRATQPINNTSGFINALDHHKVIFFKATASTKNARITGN